MSETWVWRSNNDVTRLHAVEASARPDYLGFTPTRCHDGGYWLANASVSGDPPPKCKRCLRVTGETS